jgi:hypothetical protein
MEGSPPTRFVGCSARRLTILIPGVLLAAGIVVALASTAALEQSNDSLSYLVKARDGRRLFHPHHLVFNAAVRALYLGLDWTVGARDVVLAAQVHNLVFTFVALLAVYWIGLRWLKSQLLGLIGLALYGSTTAILVYATQAEVYVPAVAVLGVAAAFFLMLVESPASTSARAGLVAAWVLAVLYHQTAVLFLIPIAVTVLLSRRWELARAVAVVSALAGAVVLGAYWIAYRAMAAESSEMGSFLDFIFSYAVTPGVRWGSAANFSWSGVARLLESHVWGLSTLIPARPGVLIAVAVTGGAAVISAWCLAGQRERLLLCFAVSWALTFLAFFVWWLPEETEFAVLTSMPICLAVMASVSTLVLSSRFGAAGARVVAAGIMVVTVLNFWGGMRFEVLPRHRTMGEAFEQARFLSTFDDGSTLRLSSFNVSGTLRFYFGGSPDSIHVIDNLERALHVGTTPPTWMVRTAWARVIVDLAEIEPRNLHSGRDGFHEPETWLRMMRWIFDLRADEGNWYADDWEIVSDGRGNSYIVVTKGSRSLSEPRELLVQLVDELEPRTPARRAFMRWMKANPERLNGSLVRE